MSMHLSPAQAAQVAGVSRWTVVRAINVQALRATRDNRNAWRIKPEDLEAWRSAHDAQSAHSEHEHVPAQSSDEDLHTYQVEVAVLRVQLEAMAAQLERERQDRGRERTAQDREREEHQETVQDLRKRLDHEQEERRGLQRQLTGASQERPIVGEAGVESAKASKGFLARLLGR